MILALVLENAYLFGAAFSSSGGPTQTCVWKYAAYSRSRGNIRSTPFAPGSYRGRLVVHDLSAVSTSSAQTITGTRCCPSSTSLSGTPPCPRHSTYVRRRDCRSSQSVLFRSSLEPLTGWRLEATGAWERRYVAAVRGNSRFLYAEDGVHVSRLSRQRHSRGKALAAPA